VYLVKDSFPVHADGVGDDSGAIQQAIDKVRAKGATGGNSRGGAGIVFVPEGRYRLSQTIYVWRGIRLIGYGQRTSPCCCWRKTPPDTRAGRGST
jgi:hypothetical protein